MTGNTGNINTGINSPLTPSTPIHEWEKPNYNRWGSSITVDGVRIPEKQYFERYIVPLLNGSREEPPPWENLYQNHISPAIGGGSLAPHVSAYLARIDEIKKQGGFQGKMDIAAINSQWEKAEFQRRFDAAKANIQPLSIREPVEDSQIFSIDDKVIISGVSLDVNQAKAIKNLLDWFR
jgi:hypothetical protein